VESRWEDPQIAADQGRPLRRLYQVTPEGEEALARAHAEERETVAAERRGVTT
jgi:DNA-binding PadR family transcriptional regulator